MLLAPGITAIVAASISLAMRPSPARAPAPPVVGSHSTISSLMSIGHWIVFTLAYGTLPCAAVAIAWARPRVRTGLTALACPSCGYSLQGIGATANCPECGSNRSMKRRFAWTHPATIERVAVALLAPGITAIVAASISLAMRPADEAPLIVLIAVAPYAILAMLILIVYRPDKPSFTLVPATTAAGLCNVVLAITMVSYWASPIDSEDVGWPITDIALLSFAYLLLFLLACPAWLVVQFRKRRRS